MKGYKIRKKRTRPWVQFAEIKDLFWFNGGHGHPKKWVQGHGSMWTNLANARAAFDQLHYFIDPNEAELIQVQVTYVQTIGEAGEDYQS